MAQSLPNLPDWEQVSTNIVRILGGNPSKFTLQGTNTYLLGRGRERLLIDTGEGKKQWTDTLRTVLDHHHASVSTCLLTHWHHDHVGGVKDLETLGPVKIYKSQPSLNPDGILDPTRVHDISNGQRFRTTDGDGGGGVLEVEAVHTPGHAKDHMCFLVTASPDASEVGALFTADNVLGHGTAVFEDLGTYLDSLHLMKSRVAAASAPARGAGDAVPKKAYPGHGAVIDDATAKIDEYIAHRRMREEEALNVLRYGTTKGPGTSTATHDSITRWSESDSESETKPAPAVGKEVVTGKEWASMEMVKVIYRHYPESLYQPAEYGLLMVLEKLKNDGKVVKTDGGKWRVSEKATL